MQFHCKAKCFLKQSSKLYKISSALKMEFMNNANTATAKGYKQIQDCIRMMKELKAEMPEKFKKIIELRESE